MLGSIDRPPSKPTLTCTPGGSSTSCEWAISRSTLLASHSIFCGSGEYRPNTYITWPSFDTFHTPGPGRLPSMTTRSGGTPRSADAAGVFGADIGAASTCGAPFQASAGKVIRHRAIAHAICRVIVSSVVLLAKIALWGRSRPEADVASNWIRERRYLDKRLNL